MLQFYDVVVALLHSHNEVVVPENRSYEDCNLNGPISPPL